MSSTNGRHGYSVTVGLLKQVFNVANVCVGDASSVVIGIQKSVKSLLAQNTLIVN